MRFVGQAPVVGHNVSFDLGFLRAHGLLTNNIGLDTWELATILLPSQPGYSLGALAERFGLALPNAHRAADDAHATGWLFELLCAEAGRLPRAVLMEIARLAYGSDWPLAEVFGAALMAAGVGRVPRDELPLDQLAPDSVLFGPWRAAEPLAPREHPEPVDATELAAMLKPGGAFSTAFPGYEFRPPQVDMLEAVAGAFNQGHHLMVEAGTGTGKSVAYLLPAIAYAAKNSTRVVISTNTINLQDQLFSKDLPDLERVLGDEPRATARPPFRAALLKGRSNYLCPRRFSALKARPNPSHDELRGIARILVWLPRTQTGDQGELSLPLPSDRFVWSQVSAENEGCSLDRCQREMGGRCFFYRARKQAEAAHVDRRQPRAADGRRRDREPRAARIPSPGDRRGAPPGGRGHRPAQLQGGRRSSWRSFSTRSTRRADAPAQRRARGAGGRGKPASAPTGAASGRSPGLLAEILTAVRAKTNDAQFHPIRDALIRLQGDAEAVHSRLEMFWEVMDDVVRELVPKMDNSEYDLRLRITAATRSQPVWVEIEVAWDNLGLLGARCCSTSSRWATRCAICRAARRRS